MTLRNVKIGTRLAIGFGIILAILMAVTVGGMLLSKSSRSDLVQVIDAAQAKTLLAADMKALALEQSAVLRNIGLHSEIKAMQAEEDRARSLGKSLDDAREKMSRFVRTPEEKAILDELNKLDKDVEGPVRQAIGLSTSFRNDEAAKILIGEMDPIVQKMLMVLGRLVELQKSANKVEVAQAIQSGDQQALVIYVVEGVVLLIAATLAVWMTRSITIPIGESVEITRRVAAGDLTSRNLISGRDETAELLIALKDMNESLGTMVSAIRNGASAIAISAGEVATGNQQLQARTEDQASSLEETASTLEQFTATVRQNADNARQASGLAANASEAALRGGESVAKVVQTMQEVAASSKRITDIINVIDGIAFQTNILALNAAVEAARAGEQGRGFAVVASEVRSLAQRSAASAKEIRGLIADSVDRVEVSTKLVEDAGHIIGQLVESVQKVAAIMPEIASASHEQSAGIDQINKAVTQMDTAIQMNASIVEQAAAAAASMANEASNLTQAVSQFRLAENTESAAPQVAKSVARRKNYGHPVQKTGNTVANRHQARQLSDGVDDDWKEF